MPRPTQTLIGAKAREAVWKGVNAVYLAVRGSLGPEPKKALLFRTMGRGSRIVDDGHIIAQCQDPRNPYIRLAADVFKEAAQRTNEKAGDGTATTLVIGGKLFNDIYALLTEGFSEFTAKSKVGAVSLRRKIIESAKKVKEEIKKQAKKVKTLEELENIAHISIGNREVGKVVAKMAWEVGIDGFIDVVEGYKGELETEVIKGMRFPAKVPGKAFVNNPQRYEMIAQDAPVLITNHNLDNTADFSNSFRAISETTLKLIVIAPSFSDNVLVNIINSCKQGFFIFPVKVPSLRTEQFEDLAVYCGANFIDKNKGKRMRNIVPQDLGYLEKLIVKETDNKEDAVATGGRGEKQEMKQKLEEGEVNGKKRKVSVQFESSLVKERIEILKGQMLETKEEQFKKLLERRIASMASAVGVIRVGDSTRASSLDLKLKIEDGVYSCKAALRGGYVEGGGLCLKKIAETLPEDDILRPALLAPYEQIQSSIDGGIVIGKDVIDPAEAIYYAVEHGVQVAANLSTVEVLTPEYEDALPGEGEYAIARAIIEFVLSQKRQMGQLKESEELVERDRMMQSFGVPTVEEAIYLDNG